MGDFDYLPEDPWSTADAYSEGRPPMGWHAGDGQAAYVPPRTNGVPSRLLADDPRVRGYPPVDGRMREYPPPDGYARPDSGPMQVYRQPDSGPRPVYRQPDSGPRPVYRQPDSGPMPAYRQPDSGPRPVYRQPDSGPMPAYQPPGNSTRVYPRPGTHPFPAYSLPGYPPPDAGPGYAPYDSGPMPAYRQPNSGPMPAYRPVNGEPVQGYPPVHGRATGEFPQPTRVIEDFSRADDQAAAEFPRAYDSVASEFPLTKDRVASEFPLADDRVAAEFPRASGRAAADSPAPRGTPILGWLPFGNRLVLLPRETQFDDDGEELREHRDVSGGWLRPAVFGAMDGLVTNSSLIAGIGGGGSGHGMIVLTGIAGLIAGAFSMATGEYISVTSQNDLTKAEVELERKQHRRDPDGKRRRLTEIFVEKGVSPNLAEAVVRQISADSDRAVNTHVREELGIDPDDLPSPRTAATASFAAFTVGALIPLSPFLLGFPVLAAALVISGVAAAAGGAALAKLTGKSMLVGGLRQFTAAFLATGIAFEIGHLIGSHVS
jgi:vacuolar iron transporter family protein